MKRALTWAAAALLGGMIGTGAARGQVTADSACPKYAVDIASFATCDGDRVARAVPEGAETRPAPAPTSGQDAIAAVRKEQTPTASKPLLPVHARKEQRRTALHKP